MFWLLICLAVIAAIFSYLLFAPFYLEINSITGLYGIRFHHLATANLVIKDNSVLLDLRIAGWKKEVDLLAKLVEKKDKRQIINKKKKRREFSLNKVRDLFKSFRIKTFYLEIDTGNMPLNGILYPCFYWISRYLDKPVHINFLNKNEIIIEVENNFARILRTII